MKLEKLEKQVLLWNKLAIAVPVVVTIILAFAYYLQAVSISMLFYISCAMYFFTAVVWWWWTMQSIKLLVKTLTSTKQNVVDVVAELKSIREVLEVDNKDNK